MMKTFIFIVNIQEKVVPFDSCTCFQEASHGMKAPWNTLSKTLAKHLDGLRAWESQAPVCSVLGQDTHLCPLFPVPQLVRLPQNVCRTDCLFLMYQQCGFWFSHKVSLFFMDFLRYGESLGKLNLQGPDSSRSFLISWISLHTHTHPHTTIIRIFSSHHPENQTCLVPCLRPQEPRLTYLLRRALMQQFQKGPIYLFHRQDATRSPCNRGSSCSSRAFKGMESCRRQR